MRAFEPAGAARLNPIEKIIDLLTKLQGQLVNDGEIEEAAFKKYSDYCSKAATSKGGEIESAKEEKDMLQATISKAASDVVTSTGKIEDSTAAVAENEAKLKKATEVRATEESTFKASEKELMQSIDMLGRAIDILDKEMAKSGATSLLQNTDMMAQLSSVVLGLSEVVEGAGLGASEDLQRLTALLQNQQQSEDGEEADAEGLSTQQQAQPAYEGKSGGILEVLDDLRDKAETQLRDIRSAEAKDVMNFDLVKQALEQELDQYKKELTEEKVGKEDATKTKATAEGNLAVTAKALADTEMDLSTVQKDCMQKSADHEATTAGRAEELKVLAKAKKIIQAQMSGAAAAAELQTGSEPISFTQLGMSRSSGSQNVGKHVVVLVQRLASQQKSTSLSQLASRISAVLRYGLAGDARDPFAKVKTLLSDMIKKLEKEQQESSNEKEYCDKEMKKTSSKKSELADDAEGLKTQIDQAAAASAKLKADVKEIQSELATLLHLGDQMKKARAKSNAVFLKDEADMQQGLNAVRSGIHVLRDYYAADKEEDESLVQIGDSENDEAFSSRMEQPEPPEKFEKSSGAGQGIISLLEVVESDLAKGLAELQTEEDDAQTAFEKETQQMKVTKAAKEQDVLYKTKEYKALDKSVSELSSDFSTTSEELAAVEDYWAKVKARCVAKPESYADKKARREQEIKGLEDALSILDSESSSFLQRRR